MLAPRSARSSRLAPAVEQRRISRLVTSHLGYAAALASRFASTASADECEDLRQVAYLGLVKAASKCPPERESTFAAYAAATITGELKRHLRDHGWLVRPPRSMQELSAALRECTGRLEQALGRPPLAAELADDLAVCVTTIIEALACESLYNGVPLEPLIPLYESGARSELDALPLDRTDHPADNRLSLIRALNTLPLSQRTALFSRYVLDKSQPEIAAELGVSQMQVSRILRSGLRAARDHYGSLRSSTTV
ncbi:sigma-70 family RNA polymerase sigma factor [Lysinibacter cavernae]|uniref:RNA polymerase sigma-B factor n=1 Tax=Lysinibacter cavernae TaxID=1640652 RepID=A0A7X5R2R6_9MICO|nr:sigma-70 family RNA polymerase sigma factor [Lysinibacter cavernae]NIH54347.1 RNA polymerase sigma-B factor [Lysinibacter cavernae]